MSTVKIEKVVANTPQSFTDTEKAQARSNIGAGTVNGTYKVLSQGSGETIKHIASIEVNVRDTASDQTKKIDFKDGNGTSLGTYWMIPTSFGGVPSIQGNGITQFVPPTLKKVFTDCSSTYYSAESSITYNWVYTGGATKNKAIQHITGLNPNRTYLIYYKVCLNSTNEYQCVCLNDGDDTYSNGLTDQWFRSPFASGNTTYPHQHNITYIASVTGKSDCYVALVGDWSSQPSRTKAQMLNHQCYVFEVS